MSFEKKILGHSIVSLDKQLAQKYVQRLTTLIDQVPLVTYSQEDVVTEKKGERILYGKWEHSLILLDKDEPIGLIVGYERKSEDNDQYPSNTLYISELAIDKNHQKKGLGKALLNEFLSFNRSVGFKHLDGEFNFSVQTNKAEWNASVINLYESFGFKVRAEKKYDNRIDVVLGLK